MSFKEVQELRKAGTLNDALNKAQEDLADDSNDIWNKRSIAWVFYDFLKLNTSIENYDQFKDYLSKLAELNLPEDEKMIFDNCAFQIGKIVFEMQKEEHPDFSKLNEIFDLIKEFHFTKPSEAYSFLYKAFHKGYKNWSRYLEFADWWDFENFMSQDHLPQEYKGKKIMSIVEQAYIAYSKKLFEGEKVIIDGFYHPEKKMNKEKLKEFLPKLEKLIEAHPEYQYPPYFKAKSLLALDDQDDVLSAFLPFAKQKRNDFWVWDLMAEIFSDSKDIVFACYCKALSLKTPEDFLVSLRQKFAELLIEEEMYPEAKTEIEKFASVRSKHDWKLSNKVKQWMETDWYKETKSKESNDELYFKHLNKAEEILFQDIPEEIIAVEFVNENKSILNFVKNKSKYGFFNYSNLLEKPNIGDVLSVRFKGEGQDGFYKVLTAKKIEKNVELDAIKEFKGLLRIITPQGFGFVEDVFVETRIINENKLSNNNEIEGKAILSFNKKKDEWGWKAIKIES